MNLIKKSLIHRLSIGEISIKGMGFWKAIGIFIVYSIVLKIFQMVPYLAEVSIYGDKLVGWTWFGTIVNDVIMVSIVISLFIKKLKVEDGINNNHVKGMKITRKDYIYCGGIIVSYIMITYGVIDDIIGKLPYLIPDEMIKAVEKLLMNSSWPVLFVQIVIVAAIFEEVIFRGIILNGMLKRYSPKKAIILSSLIFGLIHFNLPQGLNAFIVALIMSTVYYYTKSLYITMFMHAVNNSLVFFIYVPENFALKVALYIIIPILGIALFLKSKNKLDFKNRFNRCIREEECDLTVEV